MKKISAHKALCGFSLAEALITLLIVCLIVLASIPVLTKKRRAVQHGANGRWICTQNSLGQLVHWQDKTSTGDENNPDEWELGCKFVPPVNARNFAITVIGSGGGGASGISEIKKVMDSNMGSSYTPTEDGEYFVVVIGGGGGGAQGLYYSGSGCNKAAGGAGASGSVFAGKVNLYKGKTYILERGAAGVRNTGSGHNGCVRDPNRAQSGGDSKLYTEGSNDLVITAYGGEGGQNIKTGGYSVWCSSKCKGGRGGSAPALPKIVINNTNKTSQFQNDGESVLLRGEAGESGGCNKGDYNFRNATYTTGGKAYSLVPLGIYSGAGYGAGGNGSLGNRYQSASGWIQTNNYLNHLSDGTNGYVGIYQIVRKQGQGGQQAEPLQSMVPSIEGDVKITIGKVVGADTNGEETRVEIYNKFGTRSKLIRSAGGLKGEAIVAESNTDGVNSVWTDNGGGLKGDVCKKAGTEPIYDTETNKDYRTVCKKMSCSIYTESDIPPDLGSIDIKEEKGPNAVAKKYTGWTQLSYSSSHIKKTLDDQIGRDYFLMFHKNDAGTDVDYYKFTNKPGNYFTFNNALVQSYYNYNQNITAQGQTYNRLENRMYCFNDGKLNYVADCDEELSVNVASSAQRIIGYRQSYDCPDAGSAKTEAYGAGGGGGYAPDVLNFAGKGGKGAPGAVIIEW